MKWTTFHRATLTRSELLKNKLHRDHDSGYGWDISVQLWGGVGLWSSETPLKVGGSGSKASNTDSYMRSSS